MDDKFVELLNDSIESCFLGSVDVKKTTLINTRNYIIHLQNHITEKNKEIDRLQKMINELTKNPNANPDFNSNPDETKI